MVDTNSPRSRRAVLAAAAGAVAATAASAITQPTGVRAGVDGDVVLGAENTANTPTVLRNPTGPALEAHTEGSPPLGAIAAYGDEIGSTAIFAQGDAVGLEARGGPQGSAVVAIAGREGTALTGDWGAAIDVRGPAIFSRSGRVTLSAGRSYADIDLRSKGGLWSTSLCFANLMSYRPGVHVAAVRANYPIAGKARIYLNRAVSSPTYVAWVVLNAPG
jgi:hypothetical protein